MARGHPPRGPVKAPRATEVPWAGRRLYEGSIDSRWWLWAALSVIVGLAASDLLAGNHTTFSSALVLTPFLASVGVSPPAVGAVGGVAVMAGAALDVFDGIDLRVSLTRGLVVLVGTGMAAGAAHLRGRRERRLMDMTNIAETAQRAIIRQPPSVVGPVAVSAAYESSVDRAVVGGDCYEALDTPFGARLMIGDVRGHGLESVRLAAFVLGAFRALATIEPDLGRVARLLDQLTARYADDAASADVDGEEFVTAVLAEVRGSTLTVANCGHPAPLYMSGDGQVWSLAAPQPTPPLGLGSDPSLQQHRMGPRDRVLLYTDGLVESRNPEGVFFDLVSSAGRLSALPLAEGVRRVVEDVTAHARGRNADDLALLGFERLPVPGEAPDGAPAIGPGAPVAQPMGLDLTGYETLAARELPR
jgi:phosphoserine phosphatase RsbU/P